MIGFRQLVNNQESKLLTHRRGVNPKSSLLPRKWKLNLTRCQGIVLFVELMILKTLANSRRNHLRKTILKSALLIITKRQIGMNITSTDLETPAHKYRNLILHWGLQEFRINRGKMCTILKNQALICLKYNLKNFPRRHGHPLDSNNKLRKV